MPVAISSGAVLVGGVLGEILRPEFDDREKLENPVLHVRQTVVVFLEDLGGTVQVEVILASDVPRQFGHHLEKGADDLSLH